MKKMTVMIIMVITIAKKLVVIIPQAEWLKLQVRGMVILWSWVDTIRTASPCLNWFVLAYYGWKGNNNPPRSSQSASCELLITDFGCLHQLVGGNTGH